MNPLLLRRPNLMSQMVYMEPSGDMVLEMDREKSAVLFINLLSVKYSILFSSDRTDAAAAAAILTLWGAAILVLPWLFITKKHTCSISSYNAATSTWRQAGWILKVVWSDPDSKIVAAQIWPTPDTVIQPKYNSSLYSILRLGPNLVYFFNSWPTCGHTMACLWLISGKEECTAEVPTFHGGMWASGGRLVQFCYLGMMSWMHEPHNSRQDQNTQIKKQWWKRLLKYIQG